MICSALQSSLQQSRLPVLEGDKKREPGATNILAARGFRNAQFLEDGPRGAA